MLHKEKNNIVYLTYDQVYMERETHLLVAFSLCPIPDNEID